MSNNEEKLNINNFTYSNMFLLFLIGSIIGTIGEGFFTLFAYGQWESHVIALYGPFCIIYGMGMVCFYTIGRLLRKKSFIEKLILGFLFSLISCTIIELVSGLILEFGMGMRAWSYLNKPLNFRGHICLEASLIWGLLGILFIFILKPLIDKLFNKMHSKPFKVISLLLTIFMAINLSLTIVAMARWSIRHNGGSANNKIEEFIDETWNDEFMEKKFIEWRYLENEDEYQNKLHNR